MISPRVTCRTKTINGPAQKASIPSVQLAHWLQMKLIPGQQGNTRDFIFGIDVIVRFISQVMTLFPGDLIATGTPKGVGPVVAGDGIEVSVEGVGTLKNVVVDE